MEQEKVFLKRERFNFHKIGLETEMTAIWLFWDTNTNMKNCTDVLRGYSLRRQETQLNSKNYSKALPSWQVASIMQSNDKDIYSLSKIWTCHAE